MKPRLIVEQKITTFVNRYAVYEALPDGSKGTLFALAEQKRLAFKEKVTFFTGEDKQSVAFTMRAEKVMDVHGRYFVEDAGGELIGAFRKDFSKSLLNSTWHILDKQDAAAFTLKENSAVLAALRRFIGIVSDLGELIVLFFRYHFRITTPDGRVVGTYRKTTLFRDHYVLSMEDEAFATADIRLLAAQAVALDALQSR